MILVLVVDDSEDNRTIYSLCLEDAGYRVALATDGEHALVQVEKERPALVIMDHNMPRMDGWEATRRLKANPLTKDIRVLVLTGHATGDAFERAKAAGADGNFMKPCLPRELVDRVRALVG